MTDNKSEFTMEQIDNFLDIVGERNYTDPRGLFYSLYEETGIEYKDIEEPIKENMKKIVLDQLLQGYIDTRLDEKDNREIWESVNNSAVSDLIVFEEYEDYKKFTTFWKKPGENYFSTPADLFHANTIPLLDFCIQCKFGAILTDTPKFKTELDDAESKFLDDVYKRKIYIRFVIFEDFRDRMEEAMNRGDSYATVGCLTIERTSNVKKKKFYKLGIPIQVTLHGNDVLLQSIAYDGVRMEDIEPGNIFQLQDIMTKHFDVWYGIQLALLNPVTETVFVKAREKGDIIRKTKIGKGQKKRKVVYTKRYIIKAKDIEKEYEERKKNNMQCPLWYVIGHWREYSKTGKKIFIKGYWKGPERIKYLDKNLDVETINKINSLRRERKVLRDEV